MRSDIVPGGVFPDYALPDHTGTVRTLGELQGRDPLVLTLARGHHCREEHQQHLELAAFQSTIAVASTRIVTITTDDQHTLQEFRASVGAQWPFLSDPGRIVQQDLDIQEYTDPENDPMIPHTLVLEPGLVVRTVYNGYWFWGRPSVQDLWEDLRAATAEIRPDWDLSAPGLREAWAAGDRSPFQGWDGRTRAPLATT
jgi:peroxiredoxin